jgi:hypothetical protein
MKVEAVCTGHAEQCPTVIAVDEGGGEFRHVQLVEVAKIRVSPSLVGDRRHNPKNGIPVDEDGNIAECPYCGCALLVTNTSTPDALLALGQITVTPGVLELFEVYGKDPDDPQNATRFELYQQMLSQWIGKHRRGDWGSVPREDWGVNRDALRIGPDGQASNIVMSTWYFNNSKVWIITERGRHVTTVMLPEDR